VGQPPALAAAARRGLGDSSQRDSSQRDSSQGDAVQGNAVLGDAAQRDASPQAASSGPQMATGAAQNAAQSTTPSKAPNVVAMPPRKPMARWPLGLSLAASLVLAAGIGWRLADGGGSESAAEQAAEPMQASERAEVYAAAAAEEPTEAVILEPDMNRVPPPPPPPLAAEESVLRKLESPQPEMRRQAERAAVASAEAEHDAFMMDEGIAQEAAPAAGAAADAGASAFPAAPPAAAKMAAPSGNAEGAVGRSRDVRETAKSDRGEALDKVEVVGSRVARQAPAAAAPAMSVPAPPPPPAPSAVADQPYDDQPPVTADSPQFRQAWLQRIRKQLAQGQTEAARESLQEFRRRYPDTELPDDLKKVAASLPPPTP
jgi:hypothetical protein